MAAILNYVSNNNISEKEFLYVEIWVLCTTKINNTCYCYCSGVKHFFDWTTSEPKYSDTTSISSY